MTNPTVGDVAPDLALPDDTGTIRRLADRRGVYTVLYFYPKDDTSGCTIEACQFRDVNETFESEDAAVWGISPDDAGSHQAFREKFELPFTLLCDQDHAVAEAYGAWGPKVVMGKETIGLIRSSFLVGPDLRIIRAWSKVSPDGHPAEVLAALRDARAAG